MKIEKCIYDNVETKLMMAVQTKQHAMFWGINDKITVLHGKSDDFDKQYCIENNIRIFEPNYQGGTIISNCGDIAVGYTTQNTNSHWGEEVYQAIVEYLCSKNINACREGNDLLVDGYKFSGMTDDNIANGMKFTAFFVSINSCDEIIEKVCKKPRLKQPKGLNEYGVTAEEIANVIIDFTIRNEDCLCNENCEEVYNCERIENCYFCHDCTDSKNLLLCNDTHDFTEGYALCNRVVDELRFNEILKEVRERRKTSGANLRKFIQELPEFKKSNTVILNDNI